MNFVVRDERDAVECIKDFVTVVFSIFFVRFVLFICISIIFKNALSLVKYTLYVYMYTCIYNYLSQFSQIIIKPIKYAKHS